MGSINVTKARQNLYQLISSVNESHEPMHIIGKSGSVVMISEEDWKSIQETLYLTSIPKMRESIIKGKNEPLSKCSDKLDW